MEKTQFVEFILDKLDTDFNLVELLFNSPDFKNLSEVLKYKCAEFDSRSYGIIVHKKLFLNYTYEEKKECLLDLINYVDYEEVLKQSSSLYYGT